MFKKNLRQRKLNRLRKYDYSSTGYYFITICTKYMMKCFGEIKERKMALNEYGEIVKKCWFDLVNHYWNCLLDEFIIMPNHVHGIIIINNSVGNGLKPFPTNTKHYKKYSLSEIIRGFKTFSSRNINKLSKDRFCWQKSYYDHIIRNEKSLHEIRQYIKFNPIKWDEDKNNTENIFLV